MTVMRTPDERFENLPDFDFAPNYVEIDGLRQHYLDEGPKDAEPVLLLHGEPSWCYLYRHMIPPIIAAGYRVIAPDLIGFGRSDKPCDAAVYSYAGHVNWMSLFLQTMDLKNITLVCQDWGSLIGLRVAAENGDWFSRIVLANGGLPTGDQEIPRAFYLWQAFAKWSPWFPIGRIIQSGTISTLSPAVLRAYDAPFPSARYQTAARVFPKLVPTSPDNPATAANRAAWEALGQWKKPFLTAFSNRDPITRGGGKLFAAHVPGARDLQHPKIRNAGHFLQEDKGPELAKIVIEFAGST